MSDLTPQNESELTAIVSDHFEAGVALEVCGNKTLQEYGNPVRAETNLSVRQLNCIHLYEPEELVISVGAGTPLSEIEQALQAKGQTLAFEPPDLSTFYESGNSSPTIGGIVGANLAGPRRLAGGAPRDHILGFRAINGRGELFKSGGRVVKNVTGFDLSKLMCGSFGTLAILSELTLRTMPKPQASCTLVTDGLPYEAASELSIELIEQSCAPSGTSWQANSGSEGVGRFMARFEGVQTAIEGRVDRLAGRLGSMLQILRDGESRECWRQTRDLMTFTASAEVWELARPPSHLSSLVKEVLAMAPTALSVDPLRGQLVVGFETAIESRAAAMRGLGERGQGISILLKAPPDLKRSVDVFDPWTPERVRLMAEIKKAMDPRHILNPGKLGD